MKQTNEPPHNAVVDMDEYRRRKQQEAHTVPTRRPAWHNATLLAWVCVGLMAVLLGVLGVALLDMKYVEVAGECALSTEELLRVCALRYGQNLLLVDTQAVYEHLSTRPRVEVVRVERIFPHTLRIELRERTPVLAVPHLGNYLLLDAQYRVVEHCETLPAEGLLLITGISCSSYALGAEYVAEDSASLQYLHTLIDALQQYGLRSDVQEIHMENVDRASLRTHEGVLVELGRIDALSIKMPALADGLRLVRKNGFYPGVLYVAANGQLSYADSETARKYLYGSAQTEPTPAPEAPQASPQAEPSATNGAE